MHCAAPRASTGVIWSYPNNLLDDGQSAGYKTASFPVSTLATPLIDDLFAAVRAWSPRPPWETPESIKKNKSQWEAETTAAVNSPETLNAIIARHLPPDEETDGDLAETLDRAQLIGGGHRVAKKLISALVHAYLCAIPPARREIVVRSITSDKSEVGMREGWLERSICELGFTPDFLRAWLFGVLPADGISSAHWPLVVRLAREQPETALRIIANRKGLDTEPGRSVRVRILGALRYHVTAGVSADLHAEALAELRDSRNPARRVDFLRTYQMPLWEARLPIDEVKALFAPFDSAPPEEKAIGFELAAAALNASDPALPQKNFALGWLRQQAGPALGAEEKHRIIHVAWLSCDPAHVAAPPFDPFDLVLAVQPVSPEHKGTWREIQSALHGILHRDPDRFKSNLSSLIRSQGRTLRKLEESDRNFGWVFGELVQLPWGRDYILGLCDSANDAERQFGKFLFETLKMSAPSTAGARFTPEDFQVWLAELQTGRVYETIAAQILAAVPRIDAADPEMVRVFKEEVFFNCLNLPGHCLEKLRPLVDTFPILRDPILSADQYFERLRNLRTSAIKAQQIPGIRRYILRKARLDRLRLERQIEKESIFAQLVTKSYLLYGNRHAVIMGGQLSDAGGLGEFSHSVEVPRLEVIDPDYCQMRRISALRYLAARRQAAGEAEEP